MGDEIQEQRPGDPAVRITTRSCKNRKGLDRAIIGKTIAAASLTSLYTGVVAIRFTDGTYLHGEARDGSWQGDDAEIDWDGQAEDETLNEIGVLDDAAYEAKKRDARRLQIERVRRELERLERDDS
jgi:hypothetical protein